MSNRQYSTGEDTRLSRGYRIAQNATIKIGNKEWLVPAQTRRGTYRVSGDVSSCTCPDFQYRGLRCKHMFGIEFLLRKRKAPTTPGVQRTTYPQKWRQYNAAQTTEKDAIQRLLHSLCSLIEQPKQDKGRRRLSYADAVFSAAYKVYSGLSARRFTVEPPRSSS